MVRRAASGKLGEFAKVWTSICFYQRIDTSLLHFKYNSLNNDNFICSLSGGWIRISKIRFDSHVHQLSAGWTGELILTFLKIIKYIILNYHMQNEAINMQNFILGLRSSFGSWSLRIHIFIITTRRCRTTGDAYHEVNINLIYLLKNFYFLKAR